MNRSLQLFTALSLALGFSFPVAAGNNHWIDAVSISEGTSEDSSHVDILRVGIQNRWERTWFNGGAWYVGGYWDAELASLDTESDGTKYALSITPVLRYQRDSRLSSGVTPFAEAGIGAQLLSDTHMGDRDMTTAFQVGSLLGLGIGFGGRGQYELSYRFTHISNLDFKAPNDGLDLHLLKLGYNFY